MRLRPPLAVGALAAAFAGALAAAPLSQERVLDLCAGVEGITHCGRRIEAEQLKALPDLAVRDGDTLRVKLFPSGTREFADTATAGSDRGYALWDYWSPINAVVLFVTSGDEISYAVLQRATNALTALPAEPVLAPDRQRVAVADFCPARCANEITVWRVTRDGLRREATMKPAAAWADVTVAWKDGETLSIQYTVPGAAKPRTEERALSDRAWQRQ
ncbi:MAG: hypothetical protein IPM22_08315 [Betaproteobacteria bacterium]|nr:hypothetical protein [Betaproteobacteria bacterium]